MVNHTPHYMISLSEYDPLAFGAFPNNLAFDCTQLNIVVPCKLNQMEIQFPN